MSVSRCNRASALWALTLAVALSIALCLPALAVAEPPFRLDTQIEDRAGVLGTGEAEVEQAIQRLQDEDNVQLWVTYVDTFSGTGAQEWADETAVESDLGLNDVLLAVAVDDRAYAYSVDQQFPLDQAAMDAVMTVYVEPALRDDDWAGAAVAATTGISEQLDAASGGGGSGGEGSSGGSSGVVVVVVVAAVVVVVVVLVLVMRRRRHRTGAAVPGPGEAPPVSLEELRRRANAALVETDDAVKTSAEEVGFAAAQFGDEQAAPFKAALDRAHAELEQAFKLRKQLDETEDESAQRELLAQILEHTGAANSGLDAEADRFDRLRDLERTAPEMLDRLQRQADQLEARLPQAEGALAELSGVYAASALAPVATAPAEAAERLAFARQQIAAGRDDLAAASKGEAAVDALAAEGAVGQARELLDSLDRLGRELSEAQARIDAAIAETRRDIAEAQTAGGPQLQPLAAAAEVAVAAAADAAGPSGGRDPLAALRRLKDADDALEQALQQLRDQQARRARAAESYARTAGAARSALASAEDFIRTHRGGIDAGPRTTLADARRELQRAEGLAETDPESAAQHAARAQDLAEDAFSSARDQASRASAPLRGGAGGTGGMVAGMVMGGILSGVAGGVGRAAGGGSGRRGSGFSPPRFGGGGTRMRRGGGGRF